MPPRKKPQGGLTENKNRSNIIGNKGGAQNEKKSGKPTSHKNVIDKENEEPIVDNKFTMVNAQSNLRADIQNFHSLLSQMINSSTSMSNDQINRIGNQLLGLTLWNTDQTSEEDRSKCESILSLIGSLLEKDVESSQRDKPQLVVSSKTFCLAVLALIKQYPDSTHQIQHRLFQTHYAYELSLYILLSLVEKTAIASVFIENLTSPEIMEFLKSLSQAIPKDVFYLTQEMAVEAICRICFFLTSNKKDVLKTLEKNDDEILEPELKTIILGGKAGIVKLLKEMRPYLTKINKTNPNIQSFPLIELNHSTFIEPSNKKDVSKISIWLDVCKSFLCIFIGDLDIFIRLKYDQVLILSENVTDNVIIKVGVIPGSLPKRLEEVVQIPLVNQAENDQIMVEELELKFQLNKDAVAAYKIINMRCKGDVLDRNKMMEILSSSTATKPQQTSAPQPKPQQQGVTTTVIEEVVVETMMEEMMVFDKIRQETEGDEERGPARYGIASTKPIAFNALPQQKTTMSPLTESKSLPRESEQQYGQEDDMQQPFENDAGAEADVEMERNPNLPPHIPSVVSITATENNISDLSEDHEEESYDRQRVRESKRLSASKVDSLTALFAHNEPPRTAKKEAQEKKEKATTTSKQNQTPSSNQRGKKNTGATTSPFRRTATGSSKKATPRMKLPATSLGPQEEQYEDNAFEISGAHHDANDWHDDIGPFQGDQPSLISKEGSSVTPSKRKFGKKKDVEISTSTFKNPLSPFSPDQQPQIPPENLNYSDQMEVPESALDGYDFDDEIISAPPIAREILTKKTPSTAKKPPQRLPSPPPPVPSPPPKLQEKEILPSWDPKLDDESTSTARSKRKFGKKSGIPTAKQALVSATKPDQSAQKENLPPPEATESVRPSTTKKTQPKATKVTEVVKQTTVTKEKPPPKPKMSLTSATAPKIAQEAVSDMDMEPLIIKSKGTNRGAQSKINDHEDETSVFSRQNKGTTGMAGKKTQAKDRDKSTKQQPVTPNKQQQKGQPATPPPEDLPLPATEHIEAEENISWERDLIEVEKSFKISPPQQEKSTPQARDEVLSPVGPLPMKTDKQQLPDGMAEKSHDEEGEESTLAESKSKKPPLGRKSAKSAAATTAVTGMTTMLEQTTTTKMTTIKKLETVSEVDNEEANVMQETLGATEDVEEEHYTPADVTDFETTTHVHYHQKPTTETAPTTKAVTTRRTAKEKDTQKEEGYTPRKRPRRQEPVEEKEEVDSLDWQQSEEPESFEEEYEDFLPPAKKQSRGRYMDIEEEEVDFGGVGSNDEESVYTMLINEIVTLNKERAARRKARILDGMYHNVLEQLSAFIQNSFENLSKAWMENEEQTIVVKLDQQVWPLVNQIMEAIQEYERNKSTREDHLVTAMQDLIKHLNDFESLTNSYLTERDQETQQLQQEITRKRKSCQEHCSREVKSIFQTNASKLPRIGLAKDVAHLLR